MTSTTAARSIAIKDAPPNEYRPGPSGPGTVEPIGHFDFSGVADHVLESISRHLSHRMLEHYSHIRIEAQRQALDALDVARRATAGNGNGSGESASEVEIQTIVEVAADLTAQSSHSLRLSGSPPHGKLLIPLNGEMSEWLSAVARPSLFPFIPPAARSPALRVWRAVPECSWRRGRRGGVTRRRRRTSGDRER
jgi:hypothetical protein